MRQNKFILLIPQCVLFHIWAVLISVEKYRGQCLNGSSAVSAGCGKACYFVFKKSQQTQLSAVQTLQIVKEVGRVEKKITRCLPQRFYQFDHGDYILEIYPYSNTNLKSYRVV